MINIKPFKQTALLSIIVISLCACESTSGPKKQNPTDQPLTTQKEVFPELWPKRDTTPPRSPSIERQVSEILSKMTLEEKVGQIIQPELRHVAPDDVRKYHIGSILTGGDTTPNNNKYASALEWAQTAESFYQASMDESDGKVAIPLIWGSDAVHGNNKLYGATIFPHNIGLGAANDPDLMGRIGEATALEVAVTGIDWTFGPTVAVARDVRWGRTYESYSESPEIVKAYAGELVRGIQGELPAGEFRPSNLIATAKHYLADGGTTQGVDRGNTEISEKELVDIHAAGYISALDNNVLTTMASFNSWNGDKLHGNKYLLTDILKDRMGFDGFVVSDWNGHREVPGCTVVRCPRAINAGIDMIMVPEDWKELYYNIIKDVKNDTIPLARLDDAVSRILRVKVRAGLFKAGSVLERQFVGDDSLVGSPEHRALAREAVRKSLVMLKNNDNTLPLDPSANILVAGAAADNLGMQTGGWTLTWQGTGNTNDDFPGATSIFSGIQDAVAHAGGQAVLSPNGNWNTSSFSNNKSPDATIVVFGEEPYAEWHGDILNVEYQYEDKSDLALLKSLHAQGIPVISVFITGRPLWTNKELNQSDAFVVAWLPGSEGSGVADMLFKHSEGTLAYDFQGRLSFSWPKYATQGKLNVGDVDYDPLFPFGYGLTYASSTNISNELSEDSHAKQSDALEETWIFVSRVMSQWSIHLQDQDQEPVLVNGNITTSGEDANLTLSTVDKISQEDARRLVWKGLHRANVSIGAEYQQDLSMYLERDGKLQFELKVNQAPSSEVELGMVCENECNSKLKLTDYLKGKANNGAWHEVSVDLRCFANNQATLDSITEVFVLSSVGSLDLSLANIKIVPSNGLDSPSNQTFTCE